VNWKGKIVLVTGACGFIGSHLVEHLLDSGADVRAFVYYNSFGNWGWIDTLPEEKKHAIKIITGDIREPYSVRDAVKGVDIVFNLAALIAIPYSYVSPASYVRTNIDGALNVMQAAQDYGVERIIQVSTSETYGTARYAPIDEKHPMQAQSPYSATKIGADAIAYSYYRSFNLPVIIARPFNTYGPRQSARAVIPTIITQILAGEKIIKLGSSVPTRDFTFVKDTAIGMAKLAESEQAIGETVNIGSGAEISIGDLAELIKVQCNRDVMFQYEDNERMRPEESEVFRLLCDNHKLEEFTAWKPSVNLKDGIAQTIKWLEINLSHYKSQIYNI